MKILKGASESVYRWKTDSTMAKRKSTKGQTTIYKAYAYNTKDRVTRTPLKTGCELRCSEGWVFPAPLVTPLRQAK